MRDYCSKIKPVVSNKPDAKQTDALAREITNFLCYLRQLLRHSTNRYIKTHPDQDPDRWDAAEVEMSSCIKDRTSIYIGYSTSTQKLFDEVVATLDKMVYCDIEVEPCMNCANPRTRWFYWKNGNDAEDD